MDTKFERLDDDKVKFDITIPAAEVDAAIDAVYREVNGSTRIPGFRKGKAPRTVLEHSFGAEYFTSVATANLIEANSPVAVDEADFIALRDYEYETDDKLVESGQDYNYSFTIKVKPQLTLTSSEPVEVKVARPVATEEEITAQIDLLRSYYIDLREITDRPVKDEDIVAISQECSLDGEALDEGNEESRTYIVGSPTASKEFDEQLIGMSIGETKDFVMQSNVLGLKNDYPKPVTAKITVKEIHERAMPELTDEWAQQSAQVDTVEELRQQIADQITGQKESTLERDKSMACLDVLTSRLEGEIPDEVKADETTKAMRNLYMNLQDQGYTLDQYLMATGQSAEQFYQDMELQGELLAKQDLALDALARALDITVGDDDINEAFADAAVEDAEALRKEWEDDHRLSVLREEILRDKAAKWLYANAKVEFVDGPVGDEDDEDEADEADEAAEAAEPAEAVEAEAEAEPEAQADTDADAE